MYTGVLQTGLVRTVTLRSTCVGTSSRVTPEARVSLRRRAPTETGPVSANLVSTIQYSRAQSKVRQWLRHCRVNTVIDIHCRMAVTHVNTPTKSSVDYWLRSRCRTVWTDLYLFIPPANEASVYPQNSTPPVSTIPSRTAPTPPPPDTRSESLKP